VLHHEPDVVFDEEHRVGLVATDDLDAEPAERLDRWKVRRRPRRAQ
jgi:hypothetical protein